MIRTPRKKFSNRRYLSEGGCCSRGFPPVAAMVRGRAAPESQVGGRTRSSGSPGPAASAAPGSPDGVARQPGSSRRHHLAVPDSGSRRRAVGRRAVAAPSVGQERRRGLPNRFFCPICTVCCRRCRSLGARTRSRRPVSVLPGCSVNRPAQCCRRGFGRFPRPDTNLNSNYI